jgi:hypothetical protein
MFLRKIIIKKDDFSVDCEAFKVFRKYRCHPVYKIQLANGSANPDLRIRIGGNLR